MPELVQYMWSMQHARQAAGGAASAQLALPPTRLPFFYDL